MSILPWVEVLALAKKSGAAKVNNNGKIATLLLGYFGRWRRKLSGDLLVDLTYTFIRVKRIDS
jgi:hypothetical protein